MMVYILLKWQSGFFKASRKNLADSFKNTIEERESEAVNTSGKKCQMLHCI